MVRHKLDPMSQKSELHYMETEYTAQKYCTKDLSALSQFGTTAVN